MRTLQFLDVGHHAETALGVGMVERVRRSHGRLRHARATARCQFQQRFPRFSGQMVRQGEKCFLAGRANIVNPLGRHAIPQQVVVGKLRKERSRLLSLFGRLRLQIGGSRYFLHRFANLDQLRRACLGMGFEFPALGPGVGSVVVIDVAQKQTGLRLVDDQSNVAPGANGPEVLVLCLIELVEFHPGSGRVELQVEGRGLHGLLLVAGQSGKAIGKGVCDEEFHYATP